MHDEEQGVRERARERERERAREREGEREEMRGERSNGRGITSKLLRINELTQ